MALCAKFDGRRIQDCTRGLMNCPCALELLHESLEDTKRLDWLEQLMLPDCDIGALVRDWSVNGKRYGEGLRAAIDAAIKARS